MQLGDYFRCVLSHSQPRTVFSRALGNFSEVKHISPLILGKQVDVGELSSHLAPVETHLPDQSYQEALESVAVDGECIGTSGLFRIWSICWAKSLGTGKEEEKALE